MRTSQTFVAVAAGFLGVFACTSSVLARNQNEQRLDVTLTPGPFSVSGAIGDATHTQRRHRSDFEVEVEDLDPGSYDLFVANTFRGKIVVLAIAGGSQGAIEFSSASQLGKQPLSFDPRGKLIQIRSATTTLLEGVLAATPNPEAPDEDSSFENANAKIDLQNRDGSTAKGRVRLKSNRKKATLTFQFQRLAPGKHVITANDVPIAEFTPTSGGAATIKYSTAPNRSELLLDFDPADTSFEVLRDGVVVLAGSTDNGDSIGGGAETIGEIEQVFNNTGPDADASGKARLRDRATRFDFEVEVEDVPVGRYTLLVAGESVATIAVVSDRDGTEGEVEFSTDPSEAGKQPLTFDPRGQTLQIVQGETVYLSLSFPN